MIESRRWMDLNKRRLKVNGRKLMVGIQIGLISAPSTFPLENRPIYPDRTKRNLFKENWFYHTVFGSIFVNDLEEDKIGRGLRLKIEIDLHTC